MNIWHVPKIYDLAEVPNYTADLIFTIKRVCKHYFIDTVTTSRGHMVMYCKDAKTAEFDYFHSSNYEISQIILPEDTRAESLNKIVYVVDCKDFRSLDNVILLEMANDLAFYLLGVLSSYRLIDVFDVSDKTEEFLDKSDTEGDREYEARHSPK